MQQIADEIILDAQVALVDLGDERQLVHVLEDRAILVVHDPAGVVAIRNAIDRGPVASLGNFLDGEVELVARHEVDRRALAQAFVRLHRHLGADEADLQRRVGLLQRRRHLHVGGERRRRGVDDAQLVIARLRGHRVQPDARRRGVDQLAAGHQCRGLRQPGRIPEAADLPPRLIA